MPFSFLRVRSSGGESASLFSPFVNFFGVSPRDTERGLRKISILFEAMWDSSVFWNSTPLSRRHLWVMSIPLNTSVASFTLYLTWPGLFLSIPCWTTLRALANFSIFFYAPSGAEGRTSITQLLEKHPSPLSPQVFPSNTLILFTSALCVEERVGIVGNGCALGPKSYPSSLRPYLCLAGPGIHRQTGLARSNTDSDTCVHYALRDQGPKKAGS